MSIDAIPPFTRAERRKVLTICLGLFGALLLILSWIDAAGQAAGQESTRRIHTTQGGRR